MPEMTATQALQGREAWRDERAVHDYMERFTKRWAPSDREATIASAGGLRFAVAHAY